MRPCPRRDRAHWARRSAHGPDRSNRSLPLAAASLTASTAKPGEKSGLDNHEALEIEDGVQNAHTGVLEGLPQDVLLVGPGEEHEAAAAAGPAGLAPHRTGLRRCSEHPLHPLVGQVPVEAFLGLPGGPEQFPHLLQGRDILDELSEESSLKEMLKAVEKQLIMDALEKSGNNISKAARRLKVTRQHLHNKIKEYGIAT